MSEVWFQGDPLDLPSAVFLANQPPAIAAALRPLVDRLENGMPLTKDEGTRRGPGEWTLFVQVSDRVLTFRCYRKTGEARRAAAPPPEVAPPRVPPHWEKSVRSPDGREWSAEDFLATLPTALRERTGAAFTRIHQGAHVAEAEPISRDHVSATWNVKIDEQAGEALVILLTIADPNRNRPGN